MQIDRWLNLIERPAWLAVTGPTDRVWWRVLLVAGLGLGAAMLLGLVVTGGGYALAEALEAVINADAIAAFQACVVTGSKTCSVEIASLRRATGEAEIFNALHGGLIVGALGVGLLLVARPLLKRPIRSFITAAPRFRWGQLLFGLAAMGLVCAALTLAERALIPGAADLAKGPLFWPVPTWKKLAYLAAVPLGFLVAAWAEEVVCRGWMLQQTGAFTPSLPVILGLQAALFSLAHAPPDAGVFAIRMASGLAYGWAALRLAGLEFAIGAHMANNVVIGWLVGGMGVKDSDFSWTILAIELVQTLAVVILAEVLARRSSARAAPGPSGPAGPAEDGP